MKLLIDLMERGALPDRVIRRGIRRLLHKRLNEHGRDGVDAKWDRQRDLFSRLSRGPLAVATAIANQQHYELPPEFFRQVLGPRCKYSCCHYPPGVATIADAEDSMLKMTCERAGVADGMEILELGCGWGSLTIWMAERYPAARITAVSNSRYQKEFIEQRCRERGCRQVTVITADMRDFATPGRFDRVISVEMFEHMRNYRELFKRIAAWLTSDGRLFFHIFCHRDTAYLFDTEADDDWMGRYFFTGGIMPSATMPYHFNEHLAVKDHWRVSGSHYQKTCEDWLRLQDAHRDVIMGMFRHVYGPDAAAWFQRWRVFFMACGELFGYDGGSEWFVGHYLMERRFNPCAE